MTVDRAQQEGGEKQRRGLLVYVPGLGLEPSRSAALLGRLRRDLGPGWRVVRWEHGLRPLSTQRMEDVARRLAVQVRTWAGDNGVGDPVDEVVLIGHSVGGLLVRQAFLSDAGLAGVRRESPWPWTNKVSRLVLLGSPNAGFHTHRLPLLLRPAFAVVAGVRALTAEQLQAGSPFITELRLRWVDAFRGHVRGVTVVQVLGDRDDIVTVQDSLDVEYMPQAARVDVPNAGHADLVEIDRCSEPEERYAVLRHALFGELDAARLEAVPPKPADVYVVLHGIRAGKYANWVGRLATALQELNPAAVVHAPSYGYFSALDFAVPLTRRRNLRRFLDWYSRAYIETGSAPRGFAGHSNGTYMLGRALIEVPAIRFDRVYLAGCVLPREYPWRLVIDREQVQEWVHTDRAAKDWPVGWLCSALRGLGMRDVGTSGVTGFDDTPPRMQEHDQPLPGGHGAALEDGRVEQVARLLVGGEPDEDPAGPTSAPHLLVGRLVGAAALPALAGGAYVAGRWALESRDSRRARLAAASAAALIALVLGRAV